MMLQELDKWASRYIAVCIAASPEEPVRLLLDACRLPSVVECCGHDGVGAVVLRAVVQVTCVVHLVH